MLSFYLSANKNRLFRYHHNRWVTFAGYMGKGWTTSEKASSRFAFDDVRQIWLPNLMPPNTSRLQFLKFLIGTPVNIYETHQYIQH